MVVVVLSTLTCPSYKVLSGSGFDHILLRLGLVNDDEQLYPELAITPSSSSYHNQLGNCWPMKGDHGHIAIQLSKAIKPLYIGIEHVSRFITDDATSSIHSF